VWTKSQLSWLNLSHSPTLPPPVTAKQRVVRILGDLPEEGINGYEGKDFEKRKVLRKHCCYCDLVLTSMSGQHPVCERFVGQRPVILAICDVFVCRKFGVEVRDFGSSWRNGIAFAALIRGLRPELVDMSVLAQNSPRDNLERAFAIAEEHLGIPRLLDVEGILRGVQLAVAASWCLSLIPTTS